MWVLFLLLNPCWFKLNFMLNAKLEDKRDRDIDENIPISIQKKAIELKKDPTSSRDSPT